MNNIYVRMLWGFPGSSSGKKFTCQCRRHGFNPFVRKIPWLNRKWQPIPVFLLGESHGQRSLAGSVQFSSVAQLCQILCSPMDYSTPGFPVHHQLLELAQSPIESVMPSNHLILYCPLLLLPSIFPSTWCFPMSQFFTSGGKLWV